MRNSRQILLIGNQRSGSLYLERLLNSSADVSFYGELLLGMSGPRKVRVPSPLLRQRRLRHLYTGVRSLGLIRPEFVLREAFDAARTPVAGCRIMYNQLSPGVHRYLRNTDLEIVHLRRSHLLRQFVSRQQMRARDRELGAGHAHVRHGPQPVVVPIRRLIRDMRRTARRAERFATTYADKISLELSYEDAFVNGTLSRSAILELEQLFEVDDFTEDASLSRTGAADLSSAVSNWAEVAHHLTGTEFEWMLSDGRSQVG